MLTLIYIYDKLYFLTNLGVNIMYTIVTKDNFRNTFLTSDYKNKFSYEGLTALYDYFEELEADLNESIEFDLVGIAGEYSN